ncbi:MAG: zinc-binding alcohol dehydrogenase family protein [Planctomycetota bacterium]
MRAVALQEPGRFETIDAAVPSPAADEALVRVHRIGVCGTDLHAFAGRQPFFEFPRILGHELGVEVVEVGEGVTNVAVGDRCAVEPYIECNDCIACRNGKPNCCDSLSVLGVHADGGMRPYFALPARKLHRSTKLSFDQLALVETLAIGAHAVARADARVDERALVVGAGPIGLAAMQSLIGLGIQPIVGDVNEQRLAFCRDSVGIRHTVDMSRDDAIEQLQDDRGELPTLLIDATGHPASMKASADRVAHGGRVVFVGLFVGDLTVHDPTFHRKELTLLASRNALASDFTRLIELIEAGKIDTMPWINRRLSLWSLPGEFADLGGQADLVKAMVEVDAE